MNSKILVPNKTIGAITVKKLQGGEITLQEVICPIQHANESALFGFKTEELRKYLIHLKNRRGKIPIKDMEKRTPLTKRIGEVVRVLNSRKTTKPRFKHVKFNLSVEDIKTLTEYKVENLNESMIRKGLESIYEITKENGDKMNGKTINLIEVPDSKSGVRITDWKKEKNGELKGRDLLVLHNSGRLVLPVGEKMVKTNKIYGIGQEGELLENIRKDGGAILLPTGLNSVNTEKDFVVPINKVKRMVFDIREDCKNSISENFIKDYRMTNSKMEFLPVKLWNKNDHAMDIRSNILSYNYVDYDMNNIVVIGRERRLESLQHFFQEKNEEAEFGYHNFTEQKLIPYNKKNDFLKTRRVSDERKVVKEDGSVGVVGLNNLSDEEKSYLKRVNNHNSHDTSEYEEIINIVQEMSDEMIPISYKTKEHWMKDDIHWIKEDLVEQGIIAIDVAQKADGRFTMPNLEFEIRNELQYLKQKTAGELHFLLEYIEEENPKNSKKHQALINVVQGFKSSAEIREAEQKGLTGDLKDLVTKESDGTGFNANKKSKNLYSQTAGILNRNQNPQTMEPGYIPAPSKGEIRVLRQVNMRATKAKNEEEELLRTTKIIQDAKGNYFEVLNREITREMEGLRTGGLFHFPTPSSSSSLYNYNKGIDSSKGLYPKVEDIYNNVCNYLERMAARELELAAIEEALEEVIFFKGRVIKHSLRNARREKERVMEFNKSKQELLNISNRFKTKKETELNKGLINNPNKVETKVLGLEKVYNFKIDLKELEEYERKIKREMEYKRMLSSLLQLSNFPSFLNKYQIISKEKGVYKIKIDGVPQEVYAKGNLKLLNEKSISIAGIRKPQRETIKFINDAVSELVDEGYVIVSGLALGCDAIAHHQCLRKDGKTIAVLPSGFKRITPRTNIQLYKDILKKGGLVLSEYKPEEGYKDGNYSKRNKIIARLSKEVLICEAGNGTLNTYEHAKKLGRKVLVQEIDTKNNNKLMDENGEDIFLII